MAFAALALLGLAVAGAVVPPWGLPSWAVPVVAVGAALASTVVGVDEAGSALHPLVEPLLFLLFAVPLALMLDDIGVFDAVAACFPDRALLALTWLLACATVALLNLDAAVVLLTPLFVRIAHHRGRDPVALAFQPMLAACVASSALPVSNLTNLIATGSRHLTSTDFLTVLGPPTLAASVVGFAGWSWAFRGRLAPDPTAAGPAAAGDGPAERRALVIGAVTAVALVIGFIPLRALGVPAWAVAAAVVAGLLPWAGPRRLAAPPLGTAALVGSLAVLAAAAGRHLPITRLLGSGKGTLGLIRVVAVSAAGANAVNNLPAFLLGLRALPPGRPPALWAMLVGVNVGPTLLVTGTLSTLLWRQLLRRDGFLIRARDVARVGMLAGLPALAAATAILLVTTR